MLGNLFSRPDLVNLFRFTPTYNLENIRSWLLNGNALTQVPPDFTANLSLTNSIFILTLWIISFLAFAAWLFERQDINT